MNKYISVCRFICLYTCPHTHTHTCILHKTPFSSKDVVIQTLLIITAIQFPSRHIFYLKFKTGFYWKTCSSIGHRQVYIFSDNMVQGFIFQEVMLLLSQEKAKWLEITWYTTWALKSDAGKLIPCLSSGHTINRGCLLGSQSIWTSQLKGLSADRDS